MNRSLLHSVLVVAVLAAVPAAAFFEPAIRGSPAAPAPDVPPVIGPDGIGAFPAEGSLGTHGCASAVKVRDVLAGRIDAGTEVCLETTVVTTQRTDRHARGGESSKIIGHATLVAEDGSTIPMVVSYRWWQHGTPAEGMVVVVEGKVAGDASRGFRIDPVSRWVDLNHPGEEVDLWKVAAGLVPEDTYVWLPRATVGPLWRNNDGDNNVGDNHVEVGTLCPLAHLTTETTPPYFGIVQAPPIGATVRMYGAVRYDDGHGWWEVHPIRAWSLLPNEAATQGCPDRIAEGGLPPPGVVPDKPPVSVPGGS